MLATEPRLLEEVQLILEPPVKKIRTVSLSTTDSNFSVDTAANLTVETAPVVRTLELEGVKELFQDYDLQDAEAVSCVICGKNYKSKVCVKKHLWEHSVYWDLFDGLKKQQRVLSIQAAIILAIKFNPSLSLLLVTNSSSGQKKKSQHTSEKSTTQSTNSMTTSTPLSRKRKMDESSTTPTTTLSSKNSLNVSHRPTILQVNSLEKTLTNSF